MRSRGEEWWEETKRDPRKSFFFSFTSERPNFTQYIYIYRFPILKIDTRKTI